MHYQTGRAILRLDSAIDRLRHSYPFLALASMAYIKSLDANSDLDSNFRSIDALADELERVLLNGN